MDTWRERTAEHWVQSLSEGEPAARDSVPNLGAIALLAGQIEVEHASHAKRGRLRRWGGVAAAGLLSAAAATALWQYGSAPRLPAALAEVRAIEREVALEGARVGGGVGVGRALVGGDALVTGAAASAALSVTRGGTLGLGAFSELRLVASQDGGQLLGARLGRGSVKVELPKLPPGQSFAVTTPDSKVTVVGTAFEVRVAEGPAGPVTCVNVSHGKVRVESAERQALLEAGQRWVSRGEIAVCRVEDAGRVTAPSVEPNAPPSAASAPRPSAPLPQRGAPSGSESKPGTLAEENRLFLELVRARRDGRSADAKALQSKFLARYPGSVLTAQVREEQRKTE